MTRDENKYKDAHIFDPDRFFTANGELNDDDTILAFGFGRRCVLTAWKPYILSQADIVDRSICAGRYMADATVWATIVSLLATFNITKAKDKDGNTIEVEEKYSDGLARCVTSQSRLSSLSSISHR